MKIIQVDAFSNVAFEGNPAAVVLLERELSSDVYLKIAQEMNLSETAFVKKIDHQSALFSIKYFTVVDEVDMCGHATISALSVIRDTYDVPSEFIISTKAGLIDVSINEEENRTTYFYKQPKGKKRASNVSRETLEAVLRIDKDSYRTCYNVDPTVYSTGLFDLLVPVASRGLLNEIEIDRKLMIEDSKEKEIVGYHCYAIEDDVIYTRNFAPLFGIDEESATGTSNGALLTLLYQENKIEKGEYKIIQGEKIGKATTIYGCIDDEGVWIGGECYELFSGKLNI